jgi:23S rRNA (pseudouridine1915-N3)-methyltransferase
MQFAMRQVILLAGSCFSFRGVDPVSAKPALIPRKLIDSQEGDPVFMKLTLAHIGARAHAKDPFEALTTVYLERSSGMARCPAEGFRSEAFRTEEALLGWIERQEGRTPVVAVLLDSRGLQMSSEAFAAWLGARRDEGAQQMVFAIGPADGWSDAARQRASLLLSLGPMTLAHALARLVVAEQIYRAFTILAGHPYHGGH